jgi:hypothetical protein
LIRERFSNRFTGNSSRAVFIELLVVLLGVYGAFQLERWGEERRESRNERILLEQLQSEIELAEPLMEEQFQDHRDRLGDIQEVASMLIQPVGSGELNGEQCSAVLRVSIVPWNPLTLTALDEMVSSDVHSRLADRDLRTLLFSLQAAIRQLNSEMQLVRTYQRHLPDEYPELLPRGFASDGRRFMKCNTDGMRSSKSFMNHLVSNYARMQGVTGSLEDELEVLKSVRLRLEQVLGSKVE